MPGESFNAAALAAAASIALRAGLDRWHGVVCLLSCLIRYMTMSCVTEDALGDGHVRRSGAGGGGVTRPQQPIDDAAALTAEVSAAHAESVDQRLGSVELTIGLMQSTVESSARR